MDAEAESEPTESQPPTDNIQNVNTSTSVITFPNSGLQTGDLVDYVQGTASSPIGTPSGPLETTIVQSDGTITQERSYPVLVIDANTSPAWRKFNAQQADTSGYFSTAVGIDPTLDVIRFATPDGLETGDAVEYNPNGNTPLAGLNTSSIYYVKAIDPYTIKLYNTYPEATATPTGVTPSNVNTTNNTIDVSNSFTNGENVTYDAPAPFEFQSGVVDVESNSDGSLVLDSSNNPEYNLGANNIYIGENTTGGSTPNTTANLQTGDMVLYEASNPADPIGGLVSGQEYYVYRQSTYYIQLCATYADATHTILGFADPITLTLTPDLSSTGKQVNQVLAQPALGNLQSGATYTVENDTGSSFQLFNSQGVLQTFTASSLMGATGTSQIFDSGIALSAGTGLQQLYIDLTSWSGGDELLAPGAVSLRQASPQPGTGISSASAIGGSGGGGNFSFPEANGYASPMVKAYVDSCVASGGNVSITSVASPNVTSYADNAGGGFVSIGQSQSYTTTNITNLAFVGAQPDGNTGNDANISTTGNVPGGNNFVLSSTTSSTSSASGDAKGGGVVASIGSTTSGPSTIPPRPRLVRTRSSRRGP